MASLEQTSRVSRAGTSTAPVVAPRIVQRVLGSPGRPLEPPIRRPLEARLGHDFSRVRIHDDQSAGASALAVAARAYTVGRHIAFAPGRYSPATVEGRQLLSHELAHVVQQLHGPADPAVAEPLAVSGPADVAEREAARSADGGDSATAGLIFGPAIQRQDEAPTTPPAIPPPQPTTLDALVARIVTVAAALVGTDQGNRVWLVVQRQILAKAPKAKPPAHKPTDPLAPVYAEMFSEATRADLAALDTDQKRSLLNRLFDSLVPSPTASGGLAAPAAPEDNEAEAALEEQQRFVSGRIARNCEAGWASVRRQVLTRFGAFRDGRWAALERANSFYRALQPSRLLGVEGSLVHPAMQTHLDKASAHLARLPKRELEEVRKTMGKPSGFNIRPNRNSPLKLSDHSFGFAIDLDAPRNPNIGKSDTLKAPLDVLGGGTLFSGKGGTAVEAEASAFVIALISQSFVEIMSSPDLFTVATWMVTNRARDAEGLLDMTAAEAAALSMHLRGKGSLDDSALLGLAFPKGKASPQRKALAGALRRLARAWRQANPAKGKAPKPSIQATLGSIARHGFLNLAPVLVGALAGRDAGGLTWLGWADVHDFMHFQVPDDERDKLIEAAATAKVRGSPP